MEKYCWSNSETYSGKVQVANYSANALMNRSIRWELKNSNEEILATDILKASIDQGSLIDAGSITIPLGIIKTARKLKLSIYIEGTEYENSYPLWVYPADNFPPTPINITVATELDANMLERLNKGKSVLFFPDHAMVKELTVGGLFTPDYWNYSMFKGISESLKRPVSPGTMSILTKPDLPLFNDFPTEFHTNWQWWAIMKNSRPMILDNTPVGYRPLVQVVDNIDRNHKLGLIFEFTVGKGKLMVCMTDLRSLQAFPEARQLFTCLVNYMNSSNFNPAQSIQADELVDLFTNKN